MSIVPLHERILMSGDRGELRRQLRARRMAIPAGERIAAADTLATQLFALPFFPQTGYVSGYWSMQGEIGLHSFQLRLPAGLIYCLPMLHDDKQLRFAPWRPGDGLVTNRFGIPEPDVSPESALPAQAMQLVVMPLLGFDPQGRRLGMGGGWYDRSFAFRQRQSAPPWLVGVGFAAQRIDALDPQPWDVDADAICTERESLIPTAAAGTPA